MNASARARSLRALVAGSALALAGCGGSDSPTDTKPSSKPTVAAVVFLTSPGEPVVGTALTAQVRVDNTAGQPMAGTSVSFSATAGTVAPSTTTTDASGQASVTWTLGTAAGSQTLTASASGKSATLGVTAKAAAASTFEKVSGDAQTGAAGDQLPQPLVVSVKDAFGNPRSGEALTVAVTGGGGSVGSASAATGSDGRTSIQWILGQALGANGLTVTHALGTLTFTATARPGAPASVTAASGGGQTGTAGTALANPLVAQVKDRLGHLVPGAKVAFVATAGGGKPSADTVATGSDGRAQATWTLGGTAGAQTMEARVQGAGAASFAATALAGPAAKLELVSGGNQSGTVGQSLGQAVVTKVVDAFGNAVAGTVVTFTTATQGGQATPAQATTGANGQASTTWKLGNTAGTQTLTAAASGLAAVAVTAQAAAGPASLVKAAAGNTQTGTVGLALASPLVAEVVDQFGNVVAGAPMTFTPGSGSGTVSPSSGTTGTDGRTSTTWTLGTASGARSVTAAVTGATPATFTATANPRAASTFAVASGNNQTGPATSPLASPLVVAARDTFGNGVPGVAVTFSVTAGGGSVSPAAATTGSTGTASTTFTLGPMVGAHTAQAAAGTLGTVTFTATATSGPPAAMTKVSGDAQTRTVADTVTVTVEVVDISGNKVPNANVTFTVASGGGSVVAPAAVEGPFPATTGSSSTNAQGRATARWTLGTTAGAQTLTASVTGAGSVTFSATGRAGAAAALTKVAGDGQSATVGTAVATNPKVKVADSFGNGVSGTSVTFTVASGGGSVTGATQTTGSDGTATVGGWTLGAVAGANTLTASSAGLTNATFTATGTAAPSPGYDIEIRIVGSMSAAIQAAFASAAARWEQVITGDLTTVSLTAAQVDACGDVTPSEALTVDDLVIYARVIAIDGLGKVLGQAGPCYIRTSNKLPILGTMEFDEADLASMQADGTLGDVILHEMGHVVGIGTVWEDLSLLQDKGTADPYFSGAQAKAAYQGLGATIVNGVPVENTGEEGTRDSHWRETTFRTELMTGYVSGPGNELSIVTVRSLADQGYAVNTGAADAYSLPSPSPARVAAPGGEPRWERILKPKGTVGPP